MSRRRRSNKSDRAYRLDHVLDDVDQRRLDRLDQLARVVRLLDRQSRNVERKPCGTVGISSLSSPDSAMSFIRVPRMLGYTSGLLSSSVRAASRISSARPLRGARCPRFALVRVARMVSRGRRVDLGPPVHHVPRRTAGP